ncbi:hypothetical protein [Bacillus sp. 1NLA3E]|uniref:hypothetical protein n=1 Tax=Bacillus sp. 1NLA3E TaxID=666686 RepID=UPI000247EAFD|nr:hypothetical protein [Bacillus sp. 1NLA3E]AGK53179.1 hypothetical protein B1NLA3E_07075 [Bacillus sp. 1NLA3E]
MNYYNNKQVIQLLDNKTISALFRLYGIQYDSIAFKLRMTRQAIVYKQRTDSWKSYEREMVYQLLKENGCDDTFIILIHTMMQNKKKAGGSK